MTAIFVSDGIVGTLHGRWVRAVPPADLGRGTLTDDTPMPDVWELPIDGVIAPWLEVLINDINNLALLPEGWDSYGGAPLSQKAALHAVEFLERVDFVGPAPWISPTPDGMLHLEWTYPTLGLELEISDHGDVDVLLNAGDGDLEEWRSSSLGDDDRLKELLSRLNNA